MGDWRGGAPGRRTAERRGCATAADERATARARERRARERTGTDEGLS